MSDAGYRDVRHSAFVEGEDGMLEYLSRNWWVYLVRGLLAVAFGLLALLLPSVALGALILLFGIFAIMDGVAALSGLLAGIRVGPWWAQLLSGLLSLAAGVISLAWPNVTATVLLVIVASWAIVNGVLTTVLAVRFRQVLHNEWLLGISGVLCVGLGGVLLSTPGAGILSLIWLLGLFAFMWGVALIVFSFRLRRLRSS